MSNEIRETHVIEIGDGLGRVVWVNEIGLDRVYLIKWAISGIDWDPAADSITTSSFALNASRGLCGYSRVRGAAARDLEVKRAKRLIREQSKCIACRARWVKRDSVFCEKCLSAKDGDQ